MMSVESSNTEASKFNQEFEDYRRACREKYQQNKPTPIPEEHEHDEHDEHEHKHIDEHEHKHIDEHEEHEVKEEKNEEEIVNEKEAAAASPPARSATNPLSASVGSGGVGVSGNNSVKLSSSVESLKKKDSQNRRNSLDKVISFFSKKPNSPEITREKEKLKAERKKKDQDFRMAAFIAELQMQGRSDEEIQMHLFQNRDQAQFRRPRSNSVGDFFRSMQQAFKEEFSTRKNSSNGMSISVSTDNPFHAAPPANYSDDTGYSYEDLVALEPVRCGVTSLDHLPLVIFTGQQLPSAQSTCAICMGDFEHHEELRELTCAHHFHRECVDKWLSVGTKCPVCKTDARSQLPLE